MCVSFFIYALGFSFIEPEVSIEGEVDETSLSEMRLDDSVMSRYT